MAGAIPVDGPTTYKQLEALLRDRLPDLTPQQRKLAQRVLSDPEGCAFMTVAELAGAVGVNESTVVRFATALGLRGYPQLAELCQLRLREQAQLLERFEALSYLDSIDDALLSRAAAYDQANILRTFANIDADTWKRAVSTLAGASTVAVVGLRKSFAAASLLAYLLGLVRDEVTHVGAAPGMLPGGLRRLGPSDALVAISIHRYARDTVTALGVAREKGVTTIALTDNASSPLAAKADICFYADVASVSVLRSVTALVSLSQALVGAVATEMGTDSRTSLRLEEELLAAFDVYTADPDEPSGDTT